MRHYPAVDGEGMHIGSLPVWITVDVGQHGFELCGFAYMFIFFNKYSTRIFILLVFKFAKYEENFVFS